MNDFKLFKEHLGLTPKNPQEQRYADLFAEETNEKEDERARRATETARNSLAQKEREELLRGWNPKNPADNFEFFHNKITNDPRIGREKQSTLLKEKPPTIFSRLLQLCKPASRYS